MSRTLSELGADDTYRACDPSAFTFTTTVELPDLTEAVGQPRAVSAVEFGIEIGGDGYNVFAVGPAGTGKSSTVRDYLVRQATLLPVAPDWVYVHNFEKSSEPRAISMRAGRGQTLRRDMEKLVDDLKVAIRQAFESDAYEEKKRSVAKQYGEQQERLLSALNERALERGFILVSTPAGPAVFPKGPDGEPLSREEYEALPAEERAGIDGELATLNQELQQTMRGFRQVEREGREAMRALNDEITTFAAGHLIEELRGRWRDIPEVGEYLGAVLADVVENADDFEKADGEAPQMPFGLFMPGQARGDNAFRRYRVNVLVDNSALEGAPVVVESNPVMQHLVGRVEHMAQFGALLTDFTMIRAGALHCANGGFLVIEAYDLLTKPFSWDALKRTLKTRTVRVEDILQQAGYATTASLDPAPIPFSAKIVLIGEPHIYHLLLMHDPDFRELFKVKADFASEVDRTPEAEQLYAQFVGRICRDRSLPAFSPDGVARLVEYGSRLVSDQQKLTTRFVDIADVITEATHWAVSARRGRSAAVVKAQHVQKAIDQRTYRCNLTEERLRELITNRAIKIVTRGAVVGQVNGLSVLWTGDYAFGRPSRITATHRLGKGEVIDIEREVEMGGPIHSKGVLILAGYLGARYAAERPLSLSARLVFEQSYSGVEGDSASSAELYALLSSLSGAPIEQRFAVTGSVNQMGEVQAIGGVNEKIEGFFAVCKEFGLRGDEGVLIPEANVRNLMLSAQVRDAIDKRRFHIWPVCTIDEGIALLTGRPAGVRNAKGEYPRDSISRLVVDRLALLAENVREARGDTERACEGD